MMAPLYMSPTEPAELVGEDDQDECWGNDLRQGASRPR